MADLSTFINIGANTANFIGNTTANTVVLSHGSTISEVDSPVPGNFAIALSALGTVSPDQQLLVYPTAIDANHLHLTSGNLYNTELFLGNDNLYLKLANTGNVVINSNDNVGNTAQWTFGTTGNITFPTLLVDLHNGGQQYAQTLQFGDPNQQAVITGPTPTGGASAQRLIIQGQNGGTGEGGDVYLWAGDAQTNGGDIKIYAGDADVSGYGGYINIDAGSGIDGGGQLTLSGGYSSNGQGGQVTITPGYSGNANGALLSLNGGQGAGDGGPVNIQAGYGGAGGGGQVTITGGGSGFGLPNYGNVQITAGVSTWTFDNTGKLSSPYLQLDSSIFSRLSVTDPNTVFNTYVQTSFDYANIYVANGSGDALWQFTGSGKIDLPGGTSELSAGVGFVGLYSDATVGSANNGLEINSNDATYLFNQGVVTITSNVGGVSHDWVFDTNGNLDIPGNSTIGVFNATGGGAGANISIRAGAADQSVYTTSQGGDLSLVGGLGGFNDGGGGGKGGDVIIVSGASADPAGAPGNVNIKSGPFELRLDYLGNITIPGNIIMPSNSVLTGGSGSPAPSLNGFDTVGAVTVSASGNVRGGNINTNGIVTATGNVYGNNFIGNTLFISGQANIANLTYNNITNLTTANLILGLGNTQTGINVNGGGIVVGNTNEASWLYDFATTSWNSNIAISAGGNVTGTNLLTAGVVSAGGNVRGSNINTTGIVSATGNVVSGGTILASNGSATAPSIAFSADGAQDTGLYWVSDGVMGVASNSAEVANFNTVGLSVVGNVTAANVTATNATNLNNVTVNSYTYVPQTWFKGTLSSSQSLTTSADTTILYNTNADPLGWGSTAGSNGHIIPNKAGWYEIISRVEFSSGAGNTQTQINHQILVNTNSVSIAQVPNGVSAGAGMSVTATAFVNLNGTTDYITTSCYTTLAGQQCQGGSATLLIIKWIST